jgi:cytochrome c5
VPVCETKGQGRVLQCVRPGGAWPAHIPEADRVVEKRCTACDDLKRRMGQLDRIIAEWDRRQQRQTGRP